MKSILSTLVFPVMMGIPFLRELGSYVGEYRETASPCDSLRDDSSRLPELACFYKIFTFHDKPDYIVEGLYRIIDDHSLIGFANEQGKVVIRPSFRYVRPFSEGVAAFNEGGKVITNKKEILVKGGKWGFINRAGEVIVSPVYDEAEDCHQGVARVIIGGTEFKLTELSGGTSSEEN